MQIQGGQEPKGWSDAEVDQLLALVIDLDTTTTSVQQQHELTNQLLTWLFFFFVLTLGYTVARHFTPSEREIVR